MSKMKTLKLLVEKLSEDFPFQLRWSNWYQTSFLAKNDEKTEQNI